MSSDTSDPFEGLERYHKNDWVLVKSSAAL